MMARCTHWLILPLLSGLACGGAQFRGGYTTRESQPPAAKKLAAFVPGHCEDAAHEDLAPRIASVEIVETESGRTLLFEHRQGHDLLIAENHFDAGPLWVFQVVVKAENLVREWRIPRSFGATGTLVVGREIAEARRGEGFEAGLASTYLSCSLVPESSVLPRGSTNPVP
jgi:hypothetical protein